jgi:hypothetical protein
MKLELVKVKHKGQEVLSLTWWDFMHGKDRFFILKENGEILEKTGDGKVTKIKNFPQTLQQLFDKHQQDLSTKI